jgi:competence ComEA-like helix-hairpin-helix protein
MSWISYSIGRFSGVHRWPVLGVPRGLTAKEAEAIVDYRERHGDFHAWGDLLVIYGVDGKKIEAAKERMSF